MILYDFHTGASFAIAQKTAIILNLKDITFDSDVYALLLTLTSLAQKFGIEGKGGLLKAQEGESVVFEREDRSGERGERREVLPFAEPIGAQAA